MLADVPERYLSLTGAFWLFLPAEFFQEYRNLLAILQDVQVLPAVCDSIAALKAVSIICRHLIVHKIFALP